MRRAVLSVVLMCAFGFSGLAHAQDAAPAAPDAERVAAARDLMEVTGVTKQMDGMVEAMTRGFAKGAKSDTSEQGRQLTAEFEENMKKFLAYKDEMLNDFAVLYAENFTAEEMKTVADFYRSGAGAKFIAKTPELMQKGATIGIKYSEKMMQDVQGKKP